LGNCAFLYSSDSPSKAWFLTEEDRVNANERVKKDAIGGMEHSKWNREQMWEALYDPKAWFSVLIMLCANIPNGGIGNVS
jgi:MFS transporter, ACS family, allantoate permease